ncbi:response regulator containing a CheY-like receiver domain and an HTH DNA-binding domain [Desulfosporosinus orientis DSM 765]|uniref:Stage 0 sporulation protein A homolog n=1 Tax=Desulfosporosinus orientis (strain ATCC 19365 / DSM 765 / NCIMB 8382 / VKM B-1628 / Singapore I) TaxID=768706 RepID=G7W511_DESOD|nr:response regulator transcription factor [Desulfosporosinus orientis]AET65883.1 response regulator containing a CheY-like receiver domain and an HTH DNA-binding domain [Desulfosporosinus orientis DSM 765]
MSTNSEEFEKAKVKVLVVDDHTLFAEGTVSLLSFDPRIAVVGIAKNGMECQSIMSETELDVVLLDINLPDISGMELIERIKEIQPAVKILMLTEYNPQGYVTKSISKGANGFLLKDCSVKEMAQGIIRVYQGGVYFCPELETFLQPVAKNEKLHFPNKPVETLRKLLNQREVEIIELASRGLHNKEIALALGINERDVDQHVSNILSKLEVNTRLEAVLNWAYVV